MRHLFTLLVLFGLFAAPAMAEDPPAEDATTEEVTSSCDSTKQAECDAGIAAAVAACVVTEGEACAEALEVVALAGCCDCLPDGKVKDICNSLKVEDGKIVKEAAEGDEKPAEEPKAPETVEEAVETATALLDALQSKNWPLFAGCSLTLLVFGANEFGLKDKVGAKAVPWISLGVGAAGTVGLGLVAGLPVGDAIMQGVMAGVAAVGGWELLFKHILAGSKDEAPSPEEGSADSGE